MRSDKSHITRKMLNMQADRRKRRGRNEDMNGRCEKLYLYKRVNTSS